MSIRYFVALVFFLFGGTVYCSTASAKPRFERAHIGSFQTRGLWHKATKEDAPTIVMVPGSGANGPEEMVPGQLTVDGKDAPLFLQLAEPFVRAGFHVLLLGKPGIEFHRGWEPSSYFYNEKLYRNLKWKDLLENLGAGIQFVKQQSVNPEKIYVLGHSEGTQVATDFVQTDENIQGIILLGYAGEDLHTILDWQFYRRHIELFIATDVDKNKDGFVTLSEAKPWETAFKFPWKPGQDELSYTEIEMYYRSLPALKERFEKIAKSPLYADGLFDRGPIYKLTAEFPGDVFVFTGSLDYQTRATEALTLERACKKIRKENCKVKIVPRLGHGFSPPRPPRAHPLLDITVGPVSEDFIAILFDFAKKLSK